MAQVRSPARADLALSPCHHHKKSIKVTQTATPELLWKPGPRSRLRVMVRKHRAGVCMGVCMCVSLCMCICMYI
jgi:hypothetical protein